MAASRAPTVAGNVIDAMQRVHHFLKKPDMPFHVCCGWSPASAGRCSSASSRRADAAARIAKYTWEDTLIPQVSSCTDGKCFAAQFESPAPWRCIRTDLAGRTRVHNMTRWTAKLLALRHSKT